MSKEKINHDDEKQAVELAEKLRNELMKDFPNFIVFCIGDPGGFCIKDAKDRVGSMLLEAQIEDTFRNHPKLMDIFERIIREIKKDVN